MKRLPYLTTIGGAIVLLLLAIIFYNQPRVLRTIRGVESEGEARRGLVSQKPIEGVRARPRLRDDPDSDVGTVTLESMDHVPVMREANWIGNRNRVIRSPEGRIVTLQLVDESELLSITPSHSFTKFLVCQGPLRSWSVYDKHGDMILELPVAEDVAPEMGKELSIKWSWLHDAALVATISYYEPVDYSVPQYPERDSVPIRVALYLYEVDSGMVSRLRLPVDTSRGLLRLEGVSGDGALVISLTERNEDYWGPRINSEIAGYRIPEAK